MRGHQRAKKANGVIAQEQRDEAALSTGRTAWCL
jgi:hypothetical protein